MSRGKGHIPIRTCICCGAKREKKDLLRLVLDSQGMAVGDSDGKGEGRGAYVCAEQSCLTALKTSKRLSRAFKTTGPVAVHPDLFRLAATTVVMM
ncbi:MAG: YlxR family protein [Deltaproteobacteria bacterium]|nr:YlxR family protein [Deltaproteobacteria bacterium]